MWVMSHALHDFEPASWDRRMGCICVPDGDDSIFLTPDNEGRHLGGQIQLVDRTHGLTARVNHRAQRAQKRTTRLDVPKR